MEVILFLIGFALGFFAPSILTSAMVAIVGKMQTVFSSVNTEAIKTNDMFGVLAILIASMFSLIFLTRLIPLAWGLIIGVLIKLLLSFFGISLPSV